MINKLLRNFVNMGKVVTFINKVIVEIESEKEYNKLVRATGQNLQICGIYNPLENPKRIRLLE